MSSLFGYYPGDRVLDFLLVVILTVTLASSTAWLISRRLAGNAAIRHLVLLSALLCCLASPAVAWFCSATGLKLISLPILRAEEARMVPGVTQMETAPVCDPPRSPPQRSTDPPADVAEQLLPATHASTPMNATNCACPVAASAAPTNDNRQARPIPHFPLRRDFVDCGVYSGR